MYTEYRRQFILGTRIIKDDWVQKKVNNNYFLSTHPDLEVCQVKDKEKELTLIGYIIDPHNPDNSNEDCLKSITKNIKNSYDVMNELYSYSGRFVVISNVNGKVIIVTDPSALRQVFYTTVDNDLWFASQPNLLKNYFNINERDDKELIDFISSSEYGKSQRSWIGDDTIYENVYHLMPNHYFDLQEKEIKRFWVNYDRDTSFDDAIDKATIILKGSLNAIAKRGKLIQGLTAGWDSRILLAASKDIKSAIQYYVSAGDNNQTVNIDLAIAKKISNELGLDLLVMSEMEDLRKDIADKIEHDVTQGRVLRKTRTTQYFYDNFEGYININGNVSEVVRNFYGSSHPPINSEYLAELLNYKNIPFVKNNLEKWLITIPDYIKNDIDLPDLMYWEQRMGNWCAMQKAEQDIALEDFSPFNNRQLLMTLYSVENKFRKPEGYILYRKIIENIWKETLNQPINPTPFKRKFIKKVKSFIPSETKRKLKQILK